MLKKASVDDILCLQKAKIKQTEDNTKKNLLYLYCLRLYEVF